MEHNPFQTRQPDILENRLIRIPQKGAFAALAEFAADGSSMGREVGVVLPVGCGKSGCITLAPFAFRAKRTLIIAPGLSIASQLRNDFDPARPAMFYTKCKVLDGPPFPEPVEIRSDTTNAADLVEADVVITNIGQLQGADNRWIKKLPDDFFDLIVFDEGHHNVAASWDALRSKFTDAKIVNFSATPTRADGQVMAGRIVYTYPISEAIKEGYVKRLKAVVLNPKTLRYVRRADGREIEVSLAEVRRLGEQEADFRRSIVTSSETLNTIVDASINELEKLRESTGNGRLKIIASALNFEHCRQIVEAYRSRGKRADYVHSKEDGKANTGVLKRLENHDLDVIVQVRKLGEGFDHPYLSVAAVFSIFSNLSPFVQFVGRIMRVIKQGSPGHPLNNGVVVFHAGANVAQRWDDFKKYSKADQEFFDQLLPIENLDFSNASELEIVPKQNLDEDYDEVEVRSQTDVRLEEIPLLQDDPDALAALLLLQSRGYTKEQVSEALEALKPVPTTKARERQAKRAGLDMRIRTAAARALHDHGINPEGQTLDKRRLNRSNLIVLKAAIDKLVNETVGRQAGERNEFTRPQLDQVDKEFNHIVKRAVKETLDVN